MTRTSGIHRQHPRRVFRDRREAGRVLAGMLGAYRDKPGVVVLGLARGGLPVAFEVARAFLEKFGGDSMAEVRAHFDATMRMARGMHGA